MAPNKITSLRRWKRWSERRTFETNGQFENNIGPRALKGKGINNESVEYIYIKWWDKEDVFKLFHSPLLIYKTLLDCIQ